VLGPRHATSCHGAGGLSIGEEGNVGLAGMYLLRRCARAVLLYRRQWALRRRGTLMVPVAGRRDVTASEAFVTTDRVRRRAPCEIVADRRSSMPQWRVRNVMTTDVITAPEYASVAEIVALLTDRQITAVPIVDDFDVLGVVSWTDLRRKIDIGAPGGPARLDAVIPDEVIDQVLFRALTIPSGDVQAAVDDGVVTLTRRTARKTTAVAAARLSEAVPGVTDVVDQLTFDVEDTIAAAPARQADRRDPCSAGGSGALPPGQPAAPPQTGSAATASRP
jgi:CBS domain-containing protein